MLNSKMRYVRDPRALTDRLQRIINRDTVIIIGIITPISGLIDLFFIRYDEQFAAGYLPIMFTVLTMFLLFSVYRLFRGSVLQRNPILTIIIFCAILTITTAYLAPLFSWYNFLWLLPVYIAHFYYGRGKVLNAVLFVIALNGFVIKPLVQTLYYSGLGTLITDYQYAHMAATTFAILAFSVIIIDSQAVSREDNQQMAEELDQVHTESNILHTLFQLVKLGVMVITPERTVIMTNPALLALRDTNDSFIGRYVEESLELLGANNHAIEWKSLLSRATPHYEASGLKMRVNRDSSVTVNVLVEAVNDSSNKLAGYVISIDDITQQSETNAADKRFISMVASELAKPIKASHTLLSAHMSGIKQAVDETTYESLVQVQDNIEDIEHVHGDLQLFSSSDDGVGYNVVSNVQLNDLIQECIASFEFSAHQRNISLRLDSSQQLEVVTDPVRLKSVIAGLLSNAVKYTNKGSVTIVTSSEQGMARIAVSDTGRGIADNQLETLFGPYYHLNRVKDAKVPEGIGLYVAKRIVGALEGSISAQSTLGEGSVFTVSVPLKR